MSKLIITAAITGAETTKEMNPALPCSPEEQAEAAFECWKAGASIVHLHVRDKSNKPSQSLELFEKVSKLIRAKCNLILQFSTGGAVGTPVSERIAPLKLKPEMASLNAGSINFGDEVFENLPKDIAALADEMKKLKIKPEIEVYDLGMLEYGVTLVNSGLVPAPAHFQFVLGTKHGLSGSPENMFYLRSKLPAGCTFAVAGIGRHQLQVAPLAIVSGGHVRVGFEDNVYFSKGVLAQSNAQLVKRIAELSVMLQREVANPDEARKILGI
ncbi:MAG TPA: 3-keto-5-aminohexanoate cleavage protein [Bdellovibrionota bacterium]|jgi:3-keto-5-aminohexanoate cleavage enzyme